MESGSIRLEIIDAVNALTPKLRVVLVAHDLDEIPMEQGTAAAKMPFSTSGAQGPSEYSAS
jgi:RNA polymerase sigma-70 factor (ECF subfamily)